MNCKRLLAVALASTCALVSLTMSAADTSGEYRVTNTFHVGGLGNWDYLIVDSANHLLYVPRASHVMVVDAKDGHVVADMTGMTHTHGVALVPSAGRGFISDGEEGVVFVFDLKTYGVLGKVKVEDDADGIIYDPASNKVLVVSGDGGSLITFDPSIDLATGKTDKPVELGGKPEYLVTDGKGHAYININDKDQVAVVDTKTMAVTAKWPTSPGGAPVSMALDREGRRLILGCRKPARMVIMSADDGKIVSSVPVGEGADASQFDGDAFVSCRDGTLTVARETAPGSFERIQTLVTNPWAGTMGVDPATHSIYLPTALFDKPTTIKSHPDPIAGSFEILVVSR